MFKFLTATFFFFIVEFDLLAQNLVLNPGFDCGIDQCYYTIDPEDFESFVCDWSCPTYGTSDIFSTQLEDVSCYGFMPDNGINKEARQVRIGSQLPRSGSRFAGIYTYGLNEYREYLQGTLASTLTPGQTYCAEMYVSLASNVGHACNNIGMHFHEDRIWDDGTYSLNVEPQVVETNIVNDSLNWVRIIGPFEATAPFGFLTIGNFANNTLTSIEQKPFSKSPYGPWAYYFVEDVAVYPFVPHHFTITGNNSICLGEFANIYADGQLENVKWTPLLDTTNVISTGRLLHVSPEYTTAYVVSGNNCSVVVKDTVIVDVKPVKQINLGNDTTLCEGDFITLDAGTGYVKYSWQDNSTEQVLKVNAAGKYSVWAEQENGCKRYDEIMIKTQGVPGIDIGDERLLCEGPQELRIRGDSATYTWSTGSHDAFIIVDDPGTYWVIAENACGQTVDSVAVHSVNDIFIPNFVSANQDGYNDKFVIEGIGSHQKVNASIYNRWGDLIFSDDNYDGTWPRDLVKLSSGTYYYILVLPGCREFRGWLDLVNP